MKFNLERTHDYQVNLSPSAAFPAAVNPPGFTWPENAETQHYTLELKNHTTGEAHAWSAVSSPFLLSSTLPVGKYQWRVSRVSPEGIDQVSDWIDFQIDADLPDYIAPTAAQLFALCDGHDQWLMYFDEDIASIKAQCSDSYAALKRTASAAVPTAQIRYPGHYQRGQEEGKRKAIGDVRRWIDRDLVANALLYKIWGEQAHGEEAMRRLLQLAEWSPEGPASLLRPCTWGDEVGLSLSRNLFIVYHWLSPLLNVNEQAFIRSMLVRVARQARERLQQDDFRQYPGHSHTSRLPGYLGIAALTLYREHDRQECEEWLNYALMIYRGVLPFYGGVDGSWAEGPFYASSYSKWFHPFFLSVERLSDFSFYQHAFYKNFHRFAQDFIAPEQAIHPFGDGFWCKREGKEWPGFFSQNPLRIYAARFGDAKDYADCLELEAKIADYSLHLLDVVPTIKQLAYVEAVKNKPPVAEKSQQYLNRFYTHAGLGKLKHGNMAIYYRASMFSNSSHRHGDQGNMAFFDSGVDILAPTGSYGYRFGSRHHSKWTRQTIAHNLPLIGEQGQMLDDHRAVGQLVSSRTDSNYQLVTLDISQAYDDPLQRFYRTLVLIEGYGLIIVDAISLLSDQVVNWRLHSHLDVTVNSSDHSLLLGQAHSSIAAYKCKMLNQDDIRVTLEHGYTEAMTSVAKEVETDARKEVVHLDWQLPAQRRHEVVACCIRENMDFPVVSHVIDESTQKTLIKLQVQRQMILIPGMPD